MNMQITEYYMKEVRNGMSVLWRNFKRLSSNEKYIGQTDIAAEDSMCILLKETKTCFTV